VATVEVRWQRIRSRKTGAGSFPAPCLEPPVRLRYAALSSGKRTFVVAAKNACVIEKSLEHGVYLLKEVSTMTTLIML
jgi:hypothetical protein